MPGLSDIFRKAKKPEGEVEVRAISSKTYLKAMPLRDLADLDAVKNEVKAGNIIILRITPLANKSIEDVKRAVNELCEFVETVGGDIARLGEERVVVCPAGIKIWREKTPMANEPIPTAA
ncbi:MAG: cell division protein SepF [Candidatus Bathyarchaeia archaeon]